MMNGCSLSMNRRSLYCFLGYLPWPQFTQFVIVNQTVIGFLSQLSSAIFKPAASSITAITLLSSFGGPSKQIYEGKSWSKEWDGAHSNLLGCIFSWGLCNFVLRHFQYLLSSSHSADTFSNRAYSSLLFGQRMAHCIGSLTEFRHSKDPLELAREFFLLEFFVKQPDSFVERASVSRQQMRDKRCVIVFCLLVDLFSQSQRNFLVATVIIVVHGRCLQNSSLTKEIWQTKQHC